MKSIYFLFIVSILLAGLDASARKREIGIVRVVNAQTIRNGSQMDVDLVLDCSNLAIPSNDQLKIQPAIIDNTGDTVRMPYLLFPGKIRDKVNHRKVRLYGDKLQKPYQTVYLVPQQESVVVYNQSIPFDESLYGGRLVLLPEIEGCAECQRDLAEIPVAIIPYPPRVAYIIPPVQTREEQWTPIYIYFPWDKAVILPDFMDNQAELEKIDRSFERVADNPRVKLEKICLKGYASPEGAYAYNSRLAARRANAVHHYIRDKYSVNDTLFLVESVPEDWEGLRKRVDSSDLNYRNEIIEIIDSTVDPDARDSQLKQIDNDVTYRYLLRNIYPVLRRVDYGIRYNIEEPYTVQEIAEMLNAHPGQISLNELFLTAGNYPPGSEEFNQVFVIASQFYPKDEIINTNRAAAALEEGDLEGARQCLEQENHCPQAWNNLGILLWQEGRQEEAISCFEEARANGCEEADYNLKQLVTQNNVQN